MTGEKIVTDAAAATPGRSSRLVIAASLIVFALLFAGLFRLPDHLVADTGASVTSAGPLTSGVVFVQKVAPASPLHIASLDVLLATEGRPTNTTAALISVWSRGSGKLVEQSLPPGSMADNAFVHVELNRRVSASRADPLYVVLSSKSGTPDNSITAWTNSATSVLGPLFVAPSQVVATKGLPAGLSGTKATDSALVLRVYGVGPRAATAETLAHLGVAACCLLAAVLVWMWQAVIGLSPPLVGRFRTWSHAIGGAWDRSPVGRAGAALSEKHLLIFDRRVQALCVSGALAFVVLVAGEVHYSSIEIWNQVVPATSASEHTSSIVLGNPKAVRSDEWDVTTPQTLQEYLHVSSVPAATKALDVLRPWNWGFYVLGLQRGFSFMWNFWLFSCAFGVFFLSMLLTRNRFGVSVFCSLFVLFSSYNRWWGIMPDVAALTVLITAAVCFVRSRKSFTIWSSWALLIVSGAAFLLLGYPAWQVLLGYLVLLLVGACVFRKGALADVRSHLRWRVSLALAAILIAAMVGAAYVLVNLPTIQAELRTVYPGHRVSTGGDVGLLQFFSGYLDAFFTQVRYFYVNICESSSFVLIFPVVLVGLALERAASRRRGWDPVVVALAVYTCVVALYMVVGYGPLVSRITLLGFVPGVRAFIGVGLGSILLMSVYVASPREFRIRAWIPWAVAVGAFGLLLWFADEFARRYGFPPLATTLWLCGALAVAAGAMLARWRGLFMAVMLLVVFVPGIGTNPVSRGLAPIYGKALVQAAESIAAKDPQARWLVYGDVWTPQLLKAAGARVFNGVEFPPPLSAMKVLDPGSANEYVWNRFAHVQAAIGRPRSRPAFVLTQLDAYLLTIAPGDPRLATIGVDYFVLPAADRSSFPESQFKFLTGRPVDGYLIAQRKGA